MNFFLPVALFTGAGAVRAQADRLAALGGRCLIVTGGSAAKRSGALDDVTSALTDRGVTYQIFDKIRPNPTMASCIEGGRLAASMGASFIVGIGGGSPLDASKAVAVSAANPELDEAGIYSLNWPNRPLPVVLVGTTSGTGSEVTPIAVITGSDGRKRSIRSESIYGTISMGDARYTESVPLSITASTGADALAHCLESYFNNTASDISRAFAIQGAAMLLDPLRGDAAGKLPTPEERETLYNASILGGMAISITGTVLPHNLGYYLTESHGIPHGFACAVFLPALLRHAQKAAPEYTETLLRRLGIRLEELIALVESLLPQMHIHLTDEQIHALLPRWEQNANVQKTTGGVTMDEVAAIYRGLFG